MPTIDPGRGEHDDHVADLPALLLLPGLGRQPCLPRGALAGSLSLGTGADPTQWGSGSRIARSTLERGKQPGRHPDRPAGMEPAQSVASSGCRWSSKNSEAPPSATRTGSGPWRTTSPRTRRQGSEVVAVVERDGQGHRRAHPPGQLGQRDPAPPRVRHAREHRGADLDVAAGHGPGRPGRRRRVLHRQPGRHHHGQRPHQGQDQRGQGRPTARGARCGQGPGGRGVPGSLRRARDHHARAWGLRCDRGRPGRRPRRRRLRDLHRRHRRVHRRPADRARGAPHQPDLVRRDARDGGDRGTRADAAGRRVRRATTTSHCTYGAASPGSRAPGWWRRMQTWKKPSSPR